jgi:hypothetical protein
MATINNVAQQTFFQAAGGIAIGTALDTLFGEHSVPIDNTSFLKVLVEAFAQLGLSAFLAAFYFDFLSRRGVAADSVSKNISFTLSMLYSQPNLGIKLREISDFVNQSLSKTYFASVPRLHSMPDPIDSGVGQRGAGLEVKGDSDEQISNPYA